MFRMSFSKMICKILKMSSPLRFSTILMNESVKQYCSSSRVYSGATFCRTHESVKTYHQNDVIQWIRDSSKSSETMKGGTDFSKSLTSLRTSIILRLKWPSCSEFVL